MCDLCEFFDIKMFAMRALSLIRKTPTPGAYQDLLAVDICKGFGVSFANKSRSEGARFVTTSSLHYSDKPIVSRIKDTAEDAKKQKQSEKKKRDFIPKITVLDTNGNISVLTMTEASSLAERRGLKLVYVRDDTKSGRKEYKLVSKTDLVKAELAELGSDEEKSKKTSERKTKLVAVASKIEENDLKARIKKMHQWLEKKYETRVTIDIVHGDSAKAEEIYKAFEREFEKLGRLRQKVVKEDSIKFVLLPPAEEKEKPKEKRRKKQPATDELSEDKETIAPS